MTGTVTNQESWFQEMRKLYLVSPLHAHFGLSMTEIYDGKVFVDVASKEQFLNAHGHIAGSIITAVIDSALLQAVRTRCAAEDFITTLELKVNFLAPAKGMRFRCEANLIRAGGSTGVANATVTDANGEVVAAGMGTLFIRRKPKPKT
jgi:uncharacterized protein (TIGR00369 family)